MLDIISDFVEIQLDIQGGAPRHISEFPAEDLGCFRLLLDPVFDIKFDAKQC